MQFKLTKKTWIIVATAIGAAALLAVLIFGSSAGGLVSAKKLSRIVIGMPQEKVAQVVGEEAQKLVPSNVPEGTTVEESSVLWLYQTKFFNVRADLLYTCTDQKVSNGQVYFYPDVDANDGNAYQKEYDHIFNELCKVLGTPDFSIGDSFGGTLESPEWHTDAATIRLYFLCTEEGKYTIYITSW